MEKNLCVAEDFLFSFVEVLTRGLVRAKSSETREALARVGTELLSLIPSPPGFVKEWLSKYSGYSEPEPWSPLDDGDAGGGGYIESWLRKHPVHPAPVDEEQACCGGVPGGIPK
jgi:hypothetical protein